MTITAGALLKPGRFVKMQVLIPWDWGGPWGSSLVTGSLRTDRPEGHAGGWAEGKEATMTEPAPGCLPSFLPLLAVHRQGQIHG